MTPPKTKSYLNLKIKDAKHKRNQLKRIKSGISKQLQIGEISAAERQLNYKRIDFENQKLNKFVDITKVISKR